MRLPPKMPPNPVSRPPTMPGKPMPPNPVSKPPTMPGPMPRPTSMPMTNVKPAMGMKKGGSASSRADGCAQRGKTKGKMVTMAGGGKAC